MFVIGVALLFVLLGSVSGAEAATINASSCSLANVQSAVASASDGDTVRVPAGTCTWGSTLTISNKSISIIGAGAGTEAQCGAGGQGTYTCLSTTAPPFIQWTTKSTGNSPAGFSRISGITFETQSGVTSNCDPYKDAALLNISGTSGNFRLDHSAIIARDCQGMHFDGYVRGVVDHNIIEMRSAAQAVVTMHGTWGGSGEVGGYADTSWSSPTSVGSLNQMVYEDNTLQAFQSASFPWITDDHIGGRSTYRFNTFINAVQSTHGTESSGRWRGVRSQEIYRNRFNWGGSDIDSVTSIRGGTAMVWDNKATGAIRAFFDMQTQRVEEDKVFWPWGACGVFTVTSMTRSGSTVTVTHNGPSWMIPNSGGSTYLQIAGANDPAYNGIHEIRDAGGSSGTFTVSGSPASPATGNITIRGPFDGNAGFGSDTGHDAGYPCIDQAGAGQTNPITGDGPGYITDVSLAEHESDVRARVRLEQYG